MFRNGFKTLSSVALATLLAACATATPYRPAGDDEYGYRMQQLETNRYRVSFAGNSSTDKDTVQNYLLFRSAELTLEQGGDYFVVASRDDERKVSDYTTATGFGFPFYGVGFGGTVVHSRSRAYEASGVITIHEGDPPADDARAYDARQVKKNLQPNIRLPE